MDWQQDNTSNIRTLAFNQDFSCVAVGTNKNYKIFNCDPFGECFEKDDDGGANLIEMLFSTSLIAVVGNGDKPSNSPKRLKIINTKRKSIICELSFPTAVLTVKMNRKRLVVVVADQIYIYDVSCMKLLHTIETTKNQPGLISLSLSNDSILAYPVPSTNFSNVLNGGAQLLDVTSNDSNFTLSSGSSKKDKKPVNVGSILIFDAINLQPINVIVAHKGELAAISLNSQGSLIATASTKGTIIRVFDTKLCKKVGEFRRGMAGTLIHSLNFNLDSTLLCSSSNNQTIHIFKIGNSFPKTEPQEDENHLSRSNTRSSNVSLQSNNSNSRASSSEEIPTIQPASPTDESLINTLLSKKKQSETISGLLWSKSRKLSTKLINTYLPQQITSILEPVRHFAFIRINKVGPALDNSEAAEGELAEVREAKVSMSSNYKSVVALSHNSNYVMIATNEGYFYVYNIPLEKGGECELIKQYSLVED